MSQGGCPSSRKGLSSLVHSTSTFLAWTGICRVKLRLCLPRGPLSAPGYTTRHAPLVDPNLAASSSSIRMPSQRGAKHLWLACFRCREEPAVTWTGNHLIAHCYGRTRRCQLLCKDHVVCVRRADYIHTFRCWLVTSSFPTVTIDRRALFPMT